MISAAVKDEHGFFVHTLKSAFQQGETQIRVLVPDRLEAGRTYPTVYVLPVEAGREHRYGDGLAEIKSRDLHYKHQAIFIAPTFSHLPWYADHPTDPAIRQDRLGLYGSAPIFATQERFDAYRLDRRLAEAAGKLGDRPRLILTGYGGFRQHYQRAHQLLLELKIPHQYRDGPKRKHDWHSGWVEEAVELLLARELAQK